MTPRIRRRRLLALSGSGLPIALAGCLRGSGGDGGDPEEVPVGITGRGDQPTVPVEADDVIMDALGDHVSEKFVEAKRAEQSEYHVEVSEWELDRYLETF